jgi:hypothetical protein
MTMGPPAVPVPVLTAARLTPLLMLLLTAGWLFWPSIRDAGSFVRGALQLTGVLLQAALLTVVERARGRRRRRG